MPEGAGSVLVLDYRRARRLGQAPVDGAARPASAPFGGWMQARAPDAHWSLRRHMPELYSSRLVAGYLSGAMPQIRWTGAATDAYSRTPKRRSTAICILGRQCRDSAATPPRAARRWPSPCHANLRLHGADSRHTRIGRGLAEARTQFERAATLVPQSSAARHLAAIARMARHSGNRRPISRRSDSSRICERCSEPILTTRAYSAT